MKKWDSTLQFYTRCSRLIDMFTVFLSFDQVGGAQQIPIFFYEFSARKSLCKSFVKFIVEYFFVFLTGRQRVLKWVILGYYITRCGGRANKFEIVTIIVKFYCCRWIFSGRILRKKAWRIAFLIRISFYHIKEGEFSTNFPVLNGFSDENQLFPAP